MLIICNTFVHRCLSVISLKFSYITSIEATVGLYYLWSIFPSFIDKCIVIYTFDDLFKERKTLVFESSTSNINKQLFKFRFHTDKIKLN